MILKCEFCGKRYVQTRIWQRTCKNPECLSEYNRIKAKNWYKNNKKKRADYMKNYRNGFIPEVSLAK